MTLFKRSSQIVLGIPRRALLNGGAKQNLRFLIIAGNGSIGIGYSYTTEETTGTTTTQASFPVPYDRDTTNCWFMLRALKIAERLSDMGANFYSTSPAGFTGNFFTGRVTIDYIYTCLRQGQTDDLAEIIGEYAFQRTMDTSRYSDELNDAIIRLGCHESGIELQNITHKSRFQRLIRDLKSAIAEKKWYLRNLVRMYMPKNRKLLKSVRKRFE